MIRTWLEFATSPSESVILQMWLKNIQKTINFCYSTTKFSTYRIFFHVPEWYDNFRVGIFTPCLFCKSKKNLYISWVRPTTNTKFYFYGIAPQIIHLYTKLWIKMPTKRSIHVGSLKITENKRNLFAVKLAMYFFYNSIIQTKIKYLH